MSIVFYSFATSPFDQFEIITLIPFRLSSFIDLSLTNSAVFLLFALFVAHSLNNNVISNAKLIPTRWQATVEFTFAQIVNLVLDNIGNGYFVPFIWTVFLNLAILNLVGIVPYTFTPTAHIVVGFGLSFSILVGVTLLGISNFGSFYFAMLMPAGSPLILAPLLIAIELVSQLAKGVSLGVRLAANITAGHLLFAILSGFAWSMLTNGGVLAILSVFPLFIVVFITILEMAVALIQAYVFTILTSIYINDSVHLH